jgi:hypothetical protein
MTNNESELSNTLDNETSFGELATWNRVRSPEELGRFVAQRLAAVEGYETEDIV